MADNKAKMAGLVGQGTAAYRKGYLPQAIALFTEAIEMDDTHEVLYNSRALAYIRVNRFTEALSDAEKIIQLKSSWVKGYLRKGQALQGMEKFEEALMVYLEGLDREPTDKSIRDAITNVRKYITGPMGGDQPLVNPFADSKMWDKLEKHPITRQYLRQPDYRQILTHLQKHPKDLSKHMEDARIMTSVGVLLNVEIEAPVEAAGLSASGPVHEVVNVADATPLSPLSVGRPIVKEAIDMDDLESVSKGATVTEIMDDDPVSLAPMPKNKRKRSKRKFPNSADATTSSSSDSTLNLETAEPRKTLGEELSPGQSKPRKAVAGNPSPGQSKPRKAVAGNPSPGQSKPRKAVAGNPSPGQSKFREPVAGNPSPGQSKPRKAVAGNPSPGQSKFREPVAGNPSPGQSKFREPVAGNPSPGQSKPRKAVAGKPSPRPAEPKKTIGEEPSPGPSNPKTPLAGGPAPGPPESTKPVVNEPSPEPRKPLAPKPMVEEPFPRPSKPIESMAEEPCPGPSEQKPMAEEPSSEKIKTEGHSLESLKLQSKAIENKNQGNEAYKKKNFDVAIEHYQKAIELDPITISYRTNLAAVYFEQHKYDECIQECEKAVEIGRENRADFKLIAKAFARIGNAYTKKEDYKNALKFYQKSLSEHRTQETVKKAAEIDKKIKEVERLAYEDPEKSLEEKKKGNEAFTKGDYPSAIKFYTEAIQRNPRDAKIYSNRAACYTKLAEFSMAVKDAEECIALDPNFVKGYLRKGGCLMAMKDLSKAKVAYQKAMELDPNCQEAIDGYRRCSVEENDPEAVQKRVMNDPEVRQILQDPAMQSILNQMQQDPAAVKEHLQDPNIAAKIQKLIDSGLIGIRPM